MREHGTKITPVFLPADEKPLGRYFQVRSPYYQVALCNQKTPIPALSLILEAGPSDALLPCLPSAISLIKEVIILILLADVIFQFNFTATASSWVQYFVTHKAKTYRYLICVILRQAHFLLSNPINA